MSGDPHDPTIAIDRQAFIRGCRLLIRPALAASLVPLALLTSACGAVRPAPLEDGAAVLRRAVDNARSAASVRVRGDIRATHSIVGWEGIVVGTDEQYRVAAMGMVIDARRIDGLVWGRPVDRSQPWVSVPSDGSFDLGVLLRGHVDSFTTVDDAQRIELRFAGVDVLHALSHVPSTGPTTATVTIQSGFVTEVDLRLPSEVSARVELWDYGAPLTVEPVDA